ncbi:MAG: hypothetical protein ABSE93_09955 [Terriglobia bacterium]|jgi:hypothetical protein
MGFDVVDRYRRWRDFHQQAGFGDEAQWLDSGFDTSRRTISEAEVYTYSRPGFRVGSDVL